MTAALDLYAAALLEPERPLLVRSGEGDCRAAGVPRWLRPAGAVDRRLLTGLAAPVLDVGCGPGRHVHALARLGVLAVGVDVSPAAVKLARRWGALVLHGSVFGRVPGAGTWASALLLDGNIGIGGSPAALLRRLASLLAARGEVLVELEPPGTGTQISRVRLEHGSDRSPWFYWARVGLEAIDSPALSAGFDVTERWRDGDRFFARLRLT